MITRRKIIATAATTLALLPFYTLAGKGWCRSEPIVDVDGRLYSITGFANANKAHFVYEITYGDYYDLVMSLPGDVVNFVEGDGFSVSVRAFADGQEVESFATVKELGR